MPSLNKVTIIGHLGQEPDFKHTGKTDVTNISVATSERWKDKNGESHTITEWHKIVFFGKLAEIASAYLVKGSLVYIEGKLKTEDYVDKDGVKRQITKIIASNLQMLNSNNSDGGNKKTDKNLSKKSGSGANEEFFDDQEIPF